MAILTGQLLEVLQFGDAVAGIFDLPEKYLPAPGRFLPVKHLQSQSEALTQHLFKIAGPAGRHMLGTIPLDWQPGDQIICQPPQGKGFQIPPSARRVGLLVLDNQPPRILPLIGDALAQNAAVALFFQEQPHTSIMDWIPASVEINRLSALQENIDWPDYLAVEIARDNLADLTTLLGDNPTRFPGQVLVRTPMPCRGIGDCGVCAVKTTHGWKNACTDGPVFPLKELLHVAG